MLELAEALLCWGCRIFLGVPRVQLPTPGVAWEDVHPVLVGENILSTNCMPLMRKLPSGLAERVLSNPMEKQTGTGWSLAGLKLSKASCFPDLSVLQQPQPHRPLCWS